MKLIGMNCTLMKQYIEFVADRLMLELGFNKVKCYLWPPPSAVCRLVSFFFLSLVFSIYILV